MIRVLAFMGVFLLSIIGLLLLQPGDRGALLMNGNDVTRADSEPMLSTQSLPVAAQPAAPANQLASLQRLQQATEASLTKKAMQPAQGEMRALTSNVLANLRAGSPSPARQGQTRLAALVSQSVGSVGAAGDDAFLSAIAREAKYGTEEYAKLAMVSADRDTNDVKTRWIENARKQSKAMSDATAFMSSGTKKTPGFDDTIHIVKRGDSLMKLSIRYYGRTIDYTLIYEANRDVLESPDKIKIGQKLKIPPMTNA